MKKIGLRTIKTTASVLLCLILDIIFRSFLGLKITRLFYSPFFSTLATVYCLNNSKKNSVHLAKIRSFGSIIGGVFAVIYLSMIFYLINKISLEFNTLLHDMVIYLFVSLGILFLIYLINCFEASNITFVALLTYLAVCVGNTTEYSFYFYALNRVNSTIIGVILSLFTNFINFRITKNNKITVVLPLDGVLLRTNNTLSNYQIHNLNSLIENNLDIYFVTHRSPASLSYILKNININKDLVVMNGSASFNFDLNTYSNINRLDKEIEAIINKVLDKYQINYFSHYVIDDILQIYYKKLNNSGNFDFYNDRKNKKFRNFSKGIPHIEESVSYYVIIDKLSIITSLYEELTSLNLSIDIYKTFYKNLDDGSYYSLRINSSLINKKYLFKKIKDKKENEFIIAIASSNSDICYYKDADLKVSFNDASPEVLKYTDQIIYNDKDLFNLIKKYYYKKNKSK